MSTMRAAARLVTATTRQSALMRHARGYAEESKGPAGDKLRLSFTVPHKTIYKDIDV